MKNNKNQEGNFIIHFYVFEGCDDCSCYDACLPARQGNVGCGCRLSVVGLPTGETGLWLSLIFYLLSCILYLMEKIRQDNLFCNNSPFIFIWYIY